MAPGGKTLTPLPEEKALSAYLKRLGHVAIAFSGGCDSTLLTAFAIRELGAEHVLPVHVSIPMTIEQETREALRFAEHLGALSESETGCAATAGDRAQRQVALLPLQKISFYGDSARGGGKRIPDSAGRGQCG